MKNIKTFENNKFDIDAAIKYIVKPWISILKLNRPVSFYQDKKIYLRMNRELDSDSFEDFSNFFEVLKKYNLSWIFRTSSESQYELVLVYTEINKKLLNIELSANKYNL